MKLKLFIISSIFILLGISIRSNHYYYNYQINKKHLKLITNYLENNNSSILAILEIPKINLKEEIIKDIKVDQGIEIIDYNKFEQGNIILASHSGNCKVCYFSKLDQLQINDEIYIYKNKIKYIYKVETIKEKEKNTFKVEDSNNSLILITCKKNTSNIQIIIKASLIR